MFWLWCPLTLMTLGALGVLAVPLTRTTPRDYPTIVSLCLLFPLIAVGLYMTFGHSAQVRAFEQRTKLGSVTQVTQQFEQFLQKYPRDPKAWRLLGRLYTSQGQYDRAISAYAKANTLKPHDVTIMLQYAQALHYAHQNHPDAHTDQLIAEILKHDPHNIGALNLKAIDAYQRNQYRTALKIWNELLPHYAADDPEGQFLRQLIQQAHTKLQTGRKA